MSKICEVKRKLDELRKAKIIVDNDITRVEKASDVSFIEKEIKKLNSEILEVKNQKFYKKILLISSISLAFLSIIATYIFPTLTDGSQLKSLVAIGVVSSWIISSAITINNIPSFKELKSRLFDMQGKIEDKEKEKEFVKQNSKSNEQELYLLTKKRNEISSEIQILEKRLSLYNAIKRQEIEKFVSSPEFLSKIETMAFAGDMLPKEEQITEGNQIIKNL